jgi:hypothetical protein
MSTRSITLTNNIQRKIINTIYFPLLRFIQPHEQGGILIHVMNAPRVNYPFNMHRMREQGMRISNLEGEIISRSVFNGHFSFQAFNLLLDIISLIIAYLLHMTSSSIVLTCLLLSTSLRGICLSLNFLVVASKSLCRGINHTLSPGSDFLFPFRKWT